MSHDPIDDLPVDADVPARPTLRVHHRRWDIALAIAAGGAVGGSMRYGVNLLVDTPDGGFPWATFVENVLGCLLLGALMVYLVDVWRPQRYLRPFLGVGVLGGFTTFSTYTNETRELLLDGEVLLAFLYVGGTVVVGLLATWTGLHVARSAAGVTRAR